MIATLNSLLQLNRCPHQDSNYESPHSYTAMSEVSRQPRGTNNSAAIFTATRRHRDLTAKIRYRRLYPLRRFIRCNPDRYELSRHYTTLHVPQRTRRNHSLLSRQSSHLKVLVFNAICTFLVTYQYCSTQENDYDLHSTAYNKIAVTRTQKKQMH